MLASVGCLTILGVVRAISAPGASVRRSRSARFWRVSVSSYQYNCHHNGGTRTGLDGERAMKMTSKGTLLVAVAGAIGLGCSSPADDDGSMKAAAPTTLPPAYGGMQQTPPPVTNTPSTVNNPLTPAPTTPVQPAPTAQTPAPGAGGSGGAGAMPAPGTTIPTGPPGTGFALVPTGGWVAGGTNEVGIQGSFFTLSDAKRTDGLPAGSTTVMPADFLMATGPTSICLSGAASQVMVNATTAMPDYARYWGGGIGFNLADLGGTSGPQPWARGKVVGFSFNITGTTVPPAGQFRFGANFYEGAALNQDACVNITMGVNTIRFDQIVAQCYNTPPGAPIPATAQLQSLKWQIATVATAPTPFNFCVTDLKAIIQ